MTNIPPGQEPEQPPQHSTPEQPQYPQYPTSEQQAPSAPQPSYAAPQSPYAAPQYPAGQQPYAGYAPQPKSDKRTLGLLAMILGLSGLLIPFFLNNIAAIVLGIFGLLRENSKGMSITGIVSGGVGLLIWGPIVWFVLVPLVFIVNSAVESGYLY